MAHRGWPLRQPDPTGDEARLLSDQWAAVWSSVTQVMGSDKTVRANVGSWAVSALTALRGAPRSHEHMATVLCPPSVRNDLASVCWLALAEQAQAQRLDDRQKEEFEKLWTTWAAAGCALSAQTLGVRGLAQVQSQFPTLVRGLEPPHRRPRPSR